MIAQFSATLLSKEIIAEDTYQFIFEKPDNFDFIAGQYVFLDFENPVNSDDRPSMRPMSIASAPQENHLMFIMRSSESAFKKNIIAMMPGQEILMKGSIGHVALPDNIHQPVTFLIAGMGITPGRAMLKHEEIIKSPRPITVIYANRTKNSIALKEEIEQVQLENLKVIHTLTREEGEWDGENGRIDAAMIEKYVDDVKNQMYYVVGTGQFNEAMKEVLEEMGVERKNIQFDNFG